MIQLSQPLVYSGPNPYSSDPVIAVAFSLLPEDDGDLAKMADSMASAFASWWDCPTRRAGESQPLFVARFLADWSLAALNEVRGYLHAAGAQEVNDRVDIWLGHHDPALSFQCLRLAAQFFSTIDRGHIAGDAIAKVMADFWTRCRKSHPDYQAKVLMEAAKESGTPYLPFFPRLRQWQFGWGCNSLVFFESRSEEDSYSGMNVVKDKAASKLYFQMLGAPVAKHVLVNTEEELSEAVAQTGWPCVVKPLNMGQAKGVTVNIRDDQELRRAFAKTRSMTRSPLMVESYVEGDVHRLLVIRGTFYAATRREPATIIGDGKSTVIELADQFNQGRTENATPGSYLGPVPVDGELDLAIVKQGYGRESVLEAGKKIRLREIPLQGTGASNVDVTHLVHRDIKVIAESLAKTLAIQIAGFDYLTPDISRSYHEIGAFLEINGTPSLRGHLENGRDLVGVGKAILGAQPARISTVLAIVPQAELAFYSGSGLNQPGLGWRCGGVLGLGDTLLKADGRDLTKATHMLLINKCVTAVLIVCSPEEILARGLPLDRVGQCLVSPGAVDDSWLNVIRKHSDHVDLLPPPEVFPARMAELLATLPDANTSMGS